MMLYEYTSSPSMVKEFDNAKKEKNQYCVRDISFQIRNINFEFVSKEWETQGQKVACNYSSCNYYLKNVHNGSKILLLYFCIELAGEIFLLVAFVNPC